LECRANNVILVIIIFIELYYYWFKYFSANIISDSKDF